MIPAQQTHCFANNEGNIFHDVTSKTRESAGSYGRIDNYTLNKNSLIKLAALKKSNL